MVVAVLAVLAALMLPALARARDQGRGAFCLSNLRQWGLATHLYAADHDGWLPPDGTPNPGPGPIHSGWYVQLPAQLGLPAYAAMPWRTNASIEPGLSLWLCPANPRRSNGRNLFHYCLNGHVSGTGADHQAVRLDLLAQPGSLVWLFDSKNLPAVGYWGYTHTNLHAGGAQFLYLDGHARRFPRSAYWDEATDRPRTNHSEIRWMP